MLGRHAKHRQNRRNLVSVCKSRLAVLTIPSCCGQSPPNVHCTPCSLEIMRPRRILTAGANGHEFSYSGKSEKGRLVDRSIPAEKFPSKFPDNRSKRYFRMFPRNFIFRELYFSLFLFFRRRLSVILEFFQSSINDDT